MMRDNILGQPDSLGELAAYQFGGGRKALDDAAAILAGATRVVLTGMGSSLFACIPLEYYLNTRGIPATAIDASELLHYRHPLIGRGSVVVLVSRSGETVEAIKLLPLLREAGAQVIAVTNERGSALFRESSHALLVGSRTDHLIAIQTYSGTVAALLLLGAAACGEIGAWHEDMVRAAVSLAGFAAQCLSASEGWREFFEPARAVYLLGRGASTASTVEGALLFHEAARTPAVAMTGSHFRHGPVEVVDPGFRAIVFASQRKTASLDDALCRDLRALGGKILAVGPYAEDGLRWEAGAVREELAPIMEIVAVQCAAMKLAEWRGLRPGDFQFAAPVTLSEAGFDRP